MLKVWRVFCRQRPGPRRKMPLPQEREGKRQLQAAWEPLSTSRTALATVQGRQHRVSCLLSASSPTVVRACAVLADC